MGELSNDVSGALQSARNVGSDVLAAGKGAYQAAAPAVSNFVHEHPVASGITGGLAAGAGATALLYHLLHKRHDQGKTAMDKTAHDALTKLAAVEARDKQNAWEAGFALACSHMSLDEHQYRAMRKVAADRANDAK
jgi:hypothetical protein